MITDNQQFDLLFSLFNQYVFQDAKNEITNLKYFFQTSPVTSGSKLAENILKAIEDYKLESLDLPLFQSIMLRSGKNEAESKEIINKIITYKQYDKFQIEPVREEVRDIVAKVYLRKAENIYGNSPSKFLSYLKKFDFKSSDKDYLSSVAFGRIDFNTIMADQISSRVKSSFDWLNNSFQPYNEVELGQIVSVTMPSGVGKSLFAMAEALHYAISGHPCHYLALGDLSIKDFVYRMAAIYSGLPFGEATLNIKSIYESMSRDIGNNLSITCCPAATITAEEYVDWALEQKHIKIFFIDYDANFKNEAGSDGLYLTFGAIYDLLTKLTAEGKLVYVLSQPKISAFGNEVIEGYDLSDSSKKFHNVDIQISRGVCKDSAMKTLGKFKITKNRRGEVGEEFPSIRMPNGRFKVIPKGIYERLKALPEKRNYTDAEIDAMTLEYNNSVGAIKEQINTNKMMKPRGQNPF